MWRTAQADSAVRTLADAAAGLAELVTQLHRELDHPCPEPVLARARQVLTTLEQRSSNGKGAVLDDLPLFAHAPPPAPKASVNPLHDMLDQVRPDELTPRQAIDLVYELKKIRDAARRS